MSGQRVCLIWRSGWGGGQPRGRKEPQHNKPEVGDQSPSSTRPGRVRARAAAHPRWVLISATPAQLELGAKGREGGLACFLQWGALIGENGSNVQLIPKGPVGTLFLRASASWALRKLEPESGRRGRPCRLTPGVDTHPHLALPKEKRPGASIRELV